MRNSLFCLGRQLFVCFSVCLFLFAFPVYGMGDDALSRLKGYMRTVNAFGRLFPQEKVYLHLDNTSYFLGESIWFKAYVTQTDTTVEKELSRVLHVELLNPEGDVVQHRKVRLSDGMGHGDFSLTGTLASGYYEIRAYTRYMRNWDEACCFSRVIPVYTQPKSAGDYSFPFLRFYSPSFREADRALPRDERTYLEDVNRAIYLSNTKKARSAAREFLSRPCPFPDSVVSGVRFYPEGGRLLRGVSCRVAFEVSCGRRESPVSGFLCRGDGRVLCDVTTLREGRGVFDVTPDGTPLYLVFPDSAGHDVRYALPVADTSGVSLRVDAVHGDSVQVRLCGTPDAVGRLYGVSVQRDGRVCYFDTLRVPCRLSLSRSWLGGGVRQLTVFDADGRVWCDRLFFITPQAGRDYTPLSVFSSTFHPTPYSKVRMRLAGRPGSTYSLSVRDGNTQFQGSSGDALTWSLLSSDLKGYIRNAQYYFESDDSVHRYASDLLMLVQGWRRYDWPVMAGVRPFVKREPVEDRLYVDGRVLGVKKKDRVSGVDLYVTLFNEAGESQSGHCVTDSAGYYVFDLPDCTGQWRMQFSTLVGGRLSERRVRVERGYMPAVRVLSFFETSPLPTDSFSMLGSGRFFGLLSASLLPRDTVPAFKVNKKDISLGEATVEGHRNKREHTRRAWENVEWYEKREFLEYDCQELAQEYRDRGEEVPFLGDWVATKTYLINSLLGNGDGFAFHEQFTPNNPVGYASDGVHSWGPVYPRELSSDISPFSKNDKYDFYAPTLRLDELYRVYVLPPGSAYRVPASRRLWTSEIADISMNRFIKNDFAAPHSGDAYSRMLYGVTLFKHYTSDVVQKGKQRSTFDGYSVARTFYSPDYSKVALDDDDFRCTLYWNPDVKTDEKGNAYVEFWNNEACSVFSVSAEGVHRDGSPAVFPSPQQASL